MDDLLKVLDSMLGRIFYGKPVATFPENALAIGGEADAGGGRMCRE
jgi:hypothetical protein